MTVHLQVYSISDPLRHGCAEEAVRHTLRGTEVLDNCLLGYHSNGADGLVLASHVLTLVPGLRTLVAHRPGVIRPTVAARMAATASTVSGGRIDLHIVNGGAPGDQYREGDYLPHDDRYRRAHEYVGILRAVWAQTGPLSHACEFYKFDDLRPGLAPPAPARIHMGGASEAAVAFGGAHADAYLMWGEPLAAGRNRQLGFARDGEVHDDCLWMGIAAALKGLGNSAAVVGTPDRILATLQSYLDAGVDTFLISGFGGYWDPGLIPFVERMRAELTVGRATEAVGV